MKRKNERHTQHWLVVSTHLKNISQIGSFPPVGVKIKNIWNHHPTTPFAAIKKQAHHHGIAHASTDFEAVPHTTSAPQVANGLVGSW